jgi:hypothetical protein
MDGMFTAQRQGSFAPHGIFDGGHARDATRNRNSLVDVLLGADEAAQLHDAFEGFHIDLRRFQIRLTEQGRLDPCRNDGIVKLLTGSFLGRRRGASQEGGEQ